LDKTNIVYGVGTETFNYSTAGNNNYSASSITKDIIINKNTTALTLSASPSWSTNNNTNVTITGNKCPSQVTCNLFLDSVSKSNPLSQYYLEGTYNLTYNSTGNVNYTITGISYILTIINYTTPTPAGNVTTIIAICPENYFGYHNYKLPGIKKIGCK
jgi:lipopolysaccharide export system protein LptC